jgi:surface antigen
MAVGKLSILLCSTPVIAQDITNPKFFEYRSGGFVNQLVDISFGWFKTLDAQQKIAYNSALTHAIMYAENGKAVQWYQGDASGVTVPVMTWPSSDGYCRRVHISAIAYNVEKSMSATACYSETEKRWRWS